MHYVEALNAHEMDHMDEFINDQVLLGCLMVGRPDVRQDLIVDLTPGLAQGSHAQAVDAPSASRRSRW